MSISSFLNQKITIPANLNQFSSSTSTHQHAKLIAKGRSKIGKQKLFTSYLSIAYVCYILQIPAFASLHLSKKIIETARKSWKISRTIPETSCFAMSKRNLLSVDKGDGFTGFIKHKCQNDASNLRAETAYLKSEFNSRLKVALMGTFESIYFTFFIGRICVPTNVNVRNKEYFVYLTVATASTLISYWLYYMPLSFLGKWHFFYLKFD